MRQYRIMFVLGFLVLLLLTGRGAPAPAQAAETPTFPMSEQIAPCQPDSTLDARSPYLAPTGAYKVGVTAIEMIDSMRAGLFTVDGTDNRVVTIYDWYPAAVGDDAVPCPYVSSFERMNSFLGIEAQPLEMDADSTYRRMTDWPLYDFPDAPVSPGQANSSGVGYSNITSGLPSFHISPLQELFSQGYIAIDIIDTYSFLHVFVGHFNTFSQLAPSSDETQLASADFAGVVMVWDVK